MRGARSIAPGIQFTRRHRYDTWGGVVYGEETWGGLTRKTSSGVLSPNPMPISAGSRSVLVAAY